MKITLSVFLMSVSSYSFSGNGGAWGSPMGSTINERHLPSSQYNSLSIDIEDVRKKIHDDPLYSINIPISVISRSMIETKERIVIVLAESDIKLLDQILLNQSTLDIIIDNFEPITIGQSLIGESEGLKVALGRERKW